MKNFTFTGFTKVLLFFALATFSFADFPTPSPSPAYPKAPSSQPKCIQYECTKWVTTYVPCDGDYRCWIEKGVEVCAVVPINCPKDECIESKCTAWE